MGGVREARVKWRDERHLETDGTVDELRTQSVARAVRKCSGCARLWHCQSVCAQATSHVLLPSPSSSPKLAPSERAHARGCARLGLRRTAKLRTQCSAQ
eukprot:4608402-Pleurochrysis_carterae.AAC.1